MISSVNMMPAILLEEPTIMERGMPITVEQYQALYAQGLIPEKAELLEGIIVEKMLKSPVHVYIVLFLLEALRKVLGDDLYIRPEQPITCRRSEPESDLAVVRGRITDHVHDHPETAELVIEVAVSSEGIDRRKKTIYAGAGVCEYWIVLPEDRRIEVYTKPGQSDYTAWQMFTDGQTAVSETLPEFRVELSELFPR